MESEEVSLHIAQREKRIYMFLAHRVTSGSVTHCMNCNGYLLSRLLTPFSLYKVQRHRPHHNNMRCLTPYAGLGVARVTKGTTKYCPAHSPLSSPLLLLLLDHLLNPQQDQLQTELKRSVAPHQFEHPALEHRPE